MRKIIKNIMFLIAVISVLLINVPNNAVQAAANASPVKTQTVATSYINASPIDIVNNPNKYLNKNIEFTAEFLSYTSLGLDYKPAYRDKEKYIGILIRRDDNKTHTIPLSELKIFVTRELAEKNIDLEQGDKIKLKGKIFSTALGDPWMDVSSLTKLVVKTQSQSKN